MATPREVPYVWTTWITKLMAGEAHCEWASWFRAHHTYEKMPGNFDLAKWTAEHSALVREQAAALRAEGYTVFVEEQNAFKLRGRHNVTLAGKPDLVALRANAAYVIDCKTGIPRTSDHIQVLVYMLILPYIRPAWKDKIWHGKLCYHDSMADIPASAIDESFRALLRRTMEQVGGAAVLPAVPAYAECRFCDIRRQDCPQRIESPPLEIEPEHHLF